MPNGGSQRSAPSPTGSRGHLALVVFDAMGVLYSAADDVADVLIPYLRRLGSPRADAEIEEFYQRASLGALTSAQLWAACGVPADDDAYCSGHRLQPRIDALLDDLRRRDVPLACLSNDVSEWSALLRRRFGLDRSVGTWVISGDIRARKPAPEAFEALAHATGVPLNQMVFFDDRTANVGAARALGMDAVEFASVPQAREALRARGLLPPTRSTARPV